LNSWIVLLLIAIGIIFAGSVKDTTSVELAEQQILVLPHFAEERSRECI
jgi:hypothetical protein